MKKTIIFLALILFNVKTQSQSAKVIYSNKTFIDPKIEIKKDIKSFVTDLYKSADNLKFELIFNKKQSSFKINENTINKNDDNNLKTARLMVYGENVFIDHEKKAEIHTDSDNINILDKYEIPNWKVTKESKKIDGYICYKGLLNIPFKNRKGEDKVRTVIAWFSPSLPYNYGPKNFYGLPGLILELTENSTTFIATKIELTKSDIKIKFPKGKIITRQEYEKRLKAQMGM